MKIINLFLLLALVNYCFNSFYACTNTANTLSLDEPAFDLKNGVPVIQSDCKDRPLCFFSCNDVFSNSNCDAKKYGVEVTDKKAYNKGCQLGYSHYDDIYFYLRHQLKFKGNLLSKSTEKYMKKGFSVLKDYLRQIRVNEWCKTEGDYRLRQSQLLEQFQKSSKNSKKIIEMESKNDAEFNKFVFDQQNELLTRYRNKNAEQQKCSCGNVLRYLNNKDNKQVVKFVETWKRFCSPKCVQGCNNSLCKTYKYQRDKSFIRFKRDTKSESQKESKKPNSKQTKKVKKSKSEKRTKKTKKSSPKPITIVINNNNKGRRGSGCCGSAPIPPPPPFFMNQPAFPQQFVAQPQFGGQNFQQQAQFNGNQQASQQTFQQQGQFNGNQQVAQGNNVIQGGNQQNQQQGQQVANQQSGEQSGQQNGNQQAQTGEQAGNQQSGEQSGQQNGNQQASEQNQSGEQTGNQQTQTGEQNGNQQTSEQNQSGEQSNGDNSSQQGKNGKKGRKGRNSLPTKGTGRGGKLRNSNGLVGTGRKGKVGANMVSNRRRNSSNQRSNNRSKPSRSNPSPSRQSNSSRQSSSNPSRSNPRPTRTYSPPRQSNPSPSRPSSSSRQTSRR